MIEHYSDIALGAPRPFIISEYGGRNRPLESQNWSTARDWDTLKSFSSMMMSFMDRPNLMYKAVPFIVLKAEWATSPPSPWRLMRKANEPASYSGDWVYTEMIKFYQLWSEVNGTRVDVISSDPDVQVDAYVDGTSAYVILNNLNSVSHTINLNMFENSGNSLQSVFEKSMYWGGSNVALDQITHTGPLPSITLQPDATTILKYTFANNVDVNETS